MIFGLGGVGGDRASGMDGGGRSFFAFDIKIDIYRRFGNDVALSTP